MNTLGRKKCLTLAASFAVLLFWVTVIYAYDSFTADSTNEGTAPRGALRHYADPNVPFILDASPTNLGSRPTMDVISSAFTTWNNVETATINATISATQDFTSSDFDGTPTPVFNNNINEVVLIDTPAFAEALALPPGLLGIGLTRVADVNSGQIAEGSLIMVSAFGEDGGDFESTAVHELGHVLGLMHTPITPLSTLDNELLVPTMYPFALSDDTQGRTLESDDVAAISEAYPAPSFQTSFGIIAGTVKDVQNNPVFGAVVFAMNLETGAIISRFTGHETGLNGNAEFTMRGVPPGRYVVGVERLFTDTFSDFGPQRFDAYYTQADSAFLDTFLAATPTQPAATVLDIAAGQTTTADLVVQRAVGTQDDAFEDNDNNASAFDLQPGSYNLQLLPGDEDWFSVRVEDGQTLRVLARFNHALGDLDVQVFDPSGNAVVTSDSIMDDEIGAISNADAGDYLIRVLGVEGATNAYTLTVRAMLETVGGETVTEELIHDSGTPTEGFFWRTAGAGSAVRFTPPNTPATVLEAGIFITNINGGNRHAIRILADAGGTPGETIFGPVEFIVPTTGFILYDLSNGNIVVHGDFYVMIEYDGVNTPTFGSEGTPPLEQRSWDFNGTVWSLFAEQDYLIRAVVEYQTPTGTARSD